MWTFTLQTPFSDFPDETFEIYPGLIGEWYCHKVIIAYRLQSVSLSLISAWTDFVISTVEAWPSDQPYLALHDFSQPGIALQYCALMNFETCNIGVTAHGYEAVNLNMVSRALIARVAVNFNLSSSGKVSNLLRHRAGKSAQIEYQTFFNHRKSLAWLAGISDVRPQYVPTNLVTG